MLFYEQTDDSGHTEDSELSNTSGFRARIQKQLKGRTNFNMNYLRYIFLNFVQFLCCCCMKSRDNQVHSNHWYRRSMQNLRKLQLAREKLNHELDLTKLVQLNRISRFAFKIWLERRQRISVPYFRRYTIADADIERMMRNKNDEELVRGINDQRIINECMPLDSVVDRRLLYELTGFKLD